MPTTVPTRILVAPSGFKESLSPEGVCQAVAAGVRRNSWMMVAVTAYLL